MATDKVAAPAEEVKQPVDHPDFEYTVPGGKAVYRWTGHMVDASGNHFAGVCGVCGIETYHCMTHPLRKDGEIGVALATYASGGRNEPPMVFCQDHQPGADQRRAGGKIGGDKDGVMVREKAQ